MFEVSRVECDTCSSCGKEANVYIRFSYEELSLCDDCRKYVVACLRDFTTKETTKE